MPSPFPPSPSTQANRLWQLVAYVGEPYCFLVCRTCRIALPLSRVASHFSSTGGHAYSRADCARLLTAWEAIFLPSYPIKLCNEDDLANWSHPLTPTGPIPQLPVYYGLHCSYQDPATGQRCPTLYSNEKHIQKHCRKQHGWQNTRKRGRQRRLVAQKQEHHQPWEANVPCQRLTGKGALWRVTLSTPHDQDGREGEARDKTQGIRATAATTADAWDKLEAQLDRRVASQKTTGPSLRYPVHLSPWLEKTGWTTQLQDHNLWTVAELLAPPTPNETSLVALLSSFDELIEDARASILSEKVNVFALHRVNSFVRGRHFRKPLHTKLLDKTYRNYRYVWHKLLCYVYRLTISHQGPSLHYILTPGQLEAISQIPASALPSHSQSAAAGQPSRSSPPSSSVCVYPTSSPEPVCTARSRVFSPAVTLPTSLPLRSSPPYRFQKRAVVTAPANHSSSEEGNAVSKYDCVAPSTPPRLPQPADYREDRVNHEQSATENPAGSDLRDACLRLCISLLDHKLEGRLTDSIVVGFLAALGINKTCDGFDDAVLFTPKLSALVKLSQLLLVQHAVVAHKTGHAQFPNELVAEMQDRFMVYGSETPMNWILNLRAYGAKVRDNMTSLGWISWSDDGQQLSYKSLEFTMNSLRWFLHDQVQEAQDQLHDLLLLPSGDADIRSQRVPQLHLAGLKDDPTVSLANYSFLDDKRNEGILSGKERYLLHQVRQEVRLRRYFFSNSETLTWNTSHVQQYVERARAFLRRLLLLVHMTGGQPARGTELLTLRWRNSAHNEVRNIFVESGMVSFVTSYHKNYATSSSAKLIHRYLPPEVGELLVYYLWLVVPFLEQLSILSPVPSLGPLGSFLWPAGISGVAKAKKTVLSGEPSKECEELVKDEPWESYTLGMVIKEEMKRGLKTSGSILLWRHAAIAISRRHLPEGSKFQRDYGPEERSTAMDLQAAHTSKSAGVWYARDVREGLGQTASLRAEFRALSRHWHTCLGFGEPLPPRDEAAQPESGAHKVLGAALESGNRQVGQKGTREELEAELNDWLRVGSVLRVKRSRKCNSTPVEEWDF